EKASGGRSTRLRALKLVGAITGVHREFRTMRANHFNKVTAFVAVAEQRNFARAAKQLGIKASALSQSIQFLEEELGVRLLNRTTRSVAPTEAGERVLGHMRPALESIRKALDAVSDFCETANACRQDPRARRPIQRGSARQSVGRDRRAL